MVNLCVCVCVSFRTPTLPCSISITVPISNVIIIHIVLCMNVRVRLRGVYLVLFVYVRHLCVRPANSCRIIGMWQRVHRIEYHSDSERKPGAQYAFCEFYPPHTYPLPLLRFDRDLILAVPLTQPLKTKTQVEKHFYIIYKCVSIQMYPCTCVYYVLLLNSIYILNGFMSILSNIRVLSPIPSPSVSSVA